MNLTYSREGEDSDKYPASVDQLDGDTIELIRTRTVRRDYQLIDQSDAIVVLYLTDKVSPGVMSEMYYAHRNQKPVFVVFNGSVSPFLSDVSPILEKELTGLMPQLKEFSRK